MTFPLEIRILVATFLIRAKKTFFFASSDCFLEEEKEDWMEVLKWRHDIQYNGTQLNGITITNGTLSRGAQKLKGDKLKVVWAEFSTLS